MVKILHLKLSIKKIQLFSIVKWAAEFSGNLVFKWVHTTWNVGDVGPEEETQEQYVEYVIAGEEGPFKLGTHNRRAANRQADSPRLC